MAGPVYKLWRVKFTEAWHQLSANEQQQLMTKVGDALEQVGAKELVVCNSAWSDEQWAVFGVEEFPDIEAVHKHTQLLQEFNWFRYIDSSTTLGTRWESE